MFVWVFLYLGYKLQTEKLFTEFHGNTVPVLSMKPDDTNQLKYRTLWEIHVCCKTHLKSIQLIQNTTSSMLTGKEIIFLLYCFLFLVLPLSTITDLLVLLFFISSLMYTLIYRHDISVSIHSSNHFRLQSAEEGSLTKACYSICQTCWRWKHCYGISVYLPLELSHWCILIMWLQIEEFLTLCSDSAKTDRMVFHSVNG